MTTTYEAWSLTNHYTRDSARQMREEALRAIALDPSYAPAYAMVARSHIQNLIQGWIIDEKREFAEALDIVDRGLRADRRDAAMVGVAGHCFAFIARDLAKGIALIDKAIALNSNYAHAYLQSGVVRPRAGETTTAIEHLEYARRLSPRDARNYAIFQALSLAHHVAGNVAAAHDYARKSVQHNPNYRAGWTSLAASAAALGCDAEARAAAARVLELLPTFTIHGWAHLHPIDAADKFEPILQSFRRAGLPE